MLYEPYSDAKFLDVLENFDERHMAIHEAARRIRLLIAKNATVREEALDAAILEVRGCIGPYSEIDGTDEEKVAISNASLRYAITRIESLRTTQPEPPAVGTQIIYVPVHADGLEHPDCETGFVYRSSCSPIHGFVYCRYWSKHSPGELRTKAGSELTPIDLIVIKDTIPQQQVEDAMQELITAEGTHEPSNARN